MNAIRVATVADAAAVLDIYGPFCLPSSVVSFEIEPPSLSEIQSRIAKTLETHPWLVYEEDGRVIAYAYAAQHKIRPAYNWCADVSVYMAPEARGRGIGKKLYSELFDVLRQLGYFNVYAGVTIPNEASIGLHKSLGFEEIGVYKKTGYKAGGWRDVVWLSLDLQPHVEDPPPPKRFSDLPVPYLSDK